MNEQPEENPFPNENDGDKVGDKRVTGEKGHRREEEDAQCEGETLPNVKQRGGKAEGKGDRDVLDINVRGRSQDQRSVDVERQADSSVNGGCLLSSNTHETTKTVEDPSGAKEEFSQNQELNNKKSTIQNPEEKRETEKEQEECQTPLETDSDEMNKQPEETVTPNMTRDEVGHEETAKTFIREDREEQGDAKCEGDRDSGCIAEATYMNVVQQTMPNDEPRDEEKRETEKEQEECQTPLQTDSDEMNKQHEETVTPTMTRDEVGHEGNTETFIHEDREEQGDAKCEGDRDSTYANAVQETLPNVKQGDDTTEKDGDRDVFNQNGRETGQDRAACQVIKNSDSRSVTVAVQAYPPVNGERSLSTITHRNKNKMQETNRTKEMLPQNLKLNTNSTKRSLEETRRAAKRHKREECADDVEKDVAGHIKIHKEERGPVLHKPMRPEVSSWKPAHYGLGNQGATCYLNCILQVLFMTPGIDDRLSNPASDKDMELKNLFEKLKNGTCDTRSITEKFGLVDVFQQRDAAECLLLILEQLSPQVSELFQGKLRCSTKCKHHNHTIIEENLPFWILPLSLMGHHQDYNVEKGFEAVFESTLFTGDNLVYCQTCHEDKEAISECKMEKYPEILILLLKRFDFGYNMGISADVPAILKRQNVEYELYGIVNHMGSLRGGHYTATIRPPEKKIWYEFNDSVVREAEEQPFAFWKNTYKSQTTYLLLYRNTQTTGQTEEMVKQDEGSNENEKHHEAWWKRIKKIICLHIPVVILMGFGLFHFGYLFFRRNFFQSISNLLNSISWH
ncbi:hypothetical protein LDENG_00175570 [Lucifuga dentata]|nr:hypothetical protein LDENG_00175570 [Lucifuga dentata]